MRRLFPLALVLCLSPDPADYDASRCTLEFGARAALVTSRVVV